MSNENLLNIIRKILLEQQHQHTARILCNF